MEDPNTTIINGAFKDLTKRVAGEPDVEKATHILVTGIADTLAGLRTRGEYDTKTLDIALDLMRSHAPMWAQAVTVVGQPERAGSAR